MLIEKKTVLSTAGIALIAAGFSLPARAQTDESMLLKPWNEKQVVDASADARFYDSGGFGGIHDKTAMAETTSEGRMRLSTKYPIDPTIGYSVDSLTFDGRHLLVPDQLTDVSVGASSPIGLITDDWFIAASAAFGYAGDEAFGDGHAWYGKGSIMTGKELSKDSAIIIMLDYDGNRTIFPDIPLPGLAYHKTENAQLEWVIGSVESVTWKPIERLTISATYIPINIVQTTLEYEFVKNWHGFIAYNSQELAFHTEALPADRRLFYQDQQAEVGLRVDVCKAASLTIAGGYGFAREFETGFDDRSLHRLARLSDEPYLRVGFGIDF